METYLTIRETARYLKLTAKTIRRWMASGEIPYCKVKSVIRFRASDLDKWIDGGGLNLIIGETPDREGDLFGGDDDVVSLDELREKEFAAFEAEDGDLYD